jgi:hypothetical protein
MARTTAYWVAAHVAGVAAAGLGLVGAAAALGSMACSGGGSSASNTTPPCNPCGGSSSGVGGGSPQMATRDANPDGVMYPQPPGGYGHTVRLGSQAGSVIQNFQFRGYPNGDPSGGLKNVALADFFDPCNKRYKVLHISVAAVWCVPCNQETADMVAGGGAFEKQGVVFVQALDEGTSVGTGAAPSNLDYWIARYHPNFTEVLDPEVANFGVFIEAAAVPWNADVDVRTMELLDANVGYSNLTDELTPALQDVALAPRYPLATSCP